MEQKIKDIKQKCMELLNELLEQQNQGRKDARREEKARTIHSFQSDLRWLMRALPEREVWLLINEVLMEGTVEADCAHNEGDSCVCRDEN